MQGGNVRGTIVPCPLCQGCPTGTSSTRRGGGGQAVERPWRAHRRRMSGPTGWRRGRPGVGQSSTFGTRHQHRELRGRRGGGHQHRSAPFIPTTGLAARDHNPPRGAHEGPVHTACTPAPVGSPPIRNCFEDPDAVGGCSRRGGVSERGAAATKTRNTGVGRRRGRPPPNRAGASTARRALCRQMSRQQCARSRRPPRCGAKQPRLRRGWVGGCRWRGRRGAGGTPPPLRAPLVCVTLLVPLGVNGMAAAVNAVGAAKPFPHWLRGTRRRGGAPVAADGVAARVGVGLGDGAVCVERGRLDHGPGPAFFTGSCGACLPPTRPTRAWRLLTGHRRGVARPRPSAPSWQCQLDTCVMQVLPVSRGWRRTARHARFGESLAQPPRPGASRDAPRRRGGRCHQPPTGRTAVALAPATTLQGVGDLR